jgi:copper transport protein
MRMSTSERLRDAGNERRLFGISLWSRGSIAMASLITAARRAGLLLTLVAVFAALFASPAAAHAELVSITPANGAQLTSPPAKVQMTFTESVSLIEGGIRLIDGVGATVRTSVPTVRGRTVTWPMPADLPKGPYVITWRVVSSDGHPVSGASSFGIGTAAAGVPGSTTGTGSLDATTNSVATGAVAPWPVVIVRLVGYVAFALFAGVAVFVLLCAPDTSKNPTLQRLARGGLLGGAVAVIAGILVQGPYTAGVSMSRLFDTRVLQGTLVTPFGTAMMGRLALYAVLGVLAWRLPRILTPVGSWLVPAGVAGLAATIAAAGHGAASGALDLGIDALHALAAGLWVGGLVALVGLGRSVEPRALHKFSTLAMASVLTLIVTGILNSLRELDSVEQLWQTRYGLTLLIKLALVAGTLAAAAVSRRRLRQDEVPLRSVRIEAALLVAVLSVTALLSMTAPPPKQFVPASQTGSGAEVGATAQMSLGKQGRAALGVVPARTNGSHVHLLLSDTKGKPLSASRVTLKVANPDRDIAPIPVPMTKSNGIWVANYRFPFAGTWKIILTVNGVGSSAVVTTGDITIRD